VSRVTILPAEPAAIAVEPLDDAERRHLEQVEGIVFDVQRYSLHDGPGLRTNVFLKGCPLSCAWCANPESQRLQPELALYAHNCITCGQFHQRCPTGWQGTQGWSAEQVAEYGARAEVCPTGAVHWIGRRRTAGEVMAEVRRDLPFYEGGGGMTLTGGEATMQPEMALALLRLARAELINTALETAGHTRWPVLASLAPYLNTFLFDLKHTDAEVHRALTGVSNDLILENLWRLVACGAPVILRIPLIPGFNATPETVRAMAAFVGALPGRVLGIDVLPYHTLGKAKYRALGRDYTWAEQPRLRDDEVAAFVSILEQTGYRVTVGG
jgi:pyruvate formate lyase activating enzyme